MNFPIFIVPVEGGSGFRTSLGAPFNLTVEAPTVHDVEDKVKALVKEQFQRGAQVRWISIPSFVGSFAGAAIEPGPIPDDEITREWLDCIEEHRKACDEADRRRLDEEAAAQGTSP